VGVAPVQHGGEQEIEQLDDVGRDPVSGEAGGRNYLSNAIAKTNARNRIDAVRIARDAGWL
jgi:hypothetical protein